jgi:NadR type nicotinamide-nucleotide adenylyltransferase
MSLNNPKRIAIVGPESTGKTTLAEQLAAELNTLWVPEYARTYLENLERPYVEADLIDIARGQLQAEKQALPRSNDYLICDTNLLVVYIWSLFKYGRVAAELQALMNLESYDLHLLTDIDLPWTYDPQRENPDVEDRKRLFDMYEQELLKGGHPYKVISGSEAERLTQALAGTLEE